MRFAKVVFALLALTLCSAFAIQPDRVSAIDGRTITLRNHVPMEAQAKDDQGPVDSNLRLSHMTLLTTPTKAQQAAVQRLLADQQDPNSPMFHKWLTPEQYADRFGLSPADVARLSRWLTAQGFKVDSVARGRDFIVFTGTAAQAQAAFQTQIHRFSVEGKEHFANISSPSIPASMAGVVTGIRGLHNFLWKPNHQITPAPQAQNSSRLHHNYYDNTFPAQFLAPGDVTTIYDIKALYSGANAGTGQSIAVMGQSDVYLADLVDFRLGFGLPAISPACSTDAATGIITACSGNFTYVLLDQDNLMPNSGDLSESDLDLEWTNAVAPQAKIIFVNAPVNGVGESYYFAIDNLTAPIISLSYGLCELGEGTFYAADEAELLKGNAEGMTFLASTGDSGAATCDPSGTRNTTPNHLSQFGLAVGFPASSPAVTAVGGTAVQLTGLGSTYWGTTNAADGGSAIAYPPEQGWNDDAEFGQFCINNPTDSFCTGNGITNQQTAQAFLGIGATGGGVSNCTAQTGNPAVCVLGSGIPRPSYQSGLTVAGLNGQAVARFIPDISGMASPNFPGYIFCTPQSELGGTASTSTCASGIPNALEGAFTSVIGGTSVSTPVTAGIVALLNQKLGTNGLGNINTKLYALAVSSPTSFHQINSGDNTVYCIAGTPATGPAALQCPNSGILGFLASNFDAATHYNLVTGLGSLDVNNLATAWAASLGSATTTVLATSSNNITLGQSVTLTATVATAGTNAPTGTVNFFVNGSTTAVGSATISGTTAVLATTALPAGTDVMTATYLGDANNAASTSTNSVTITVVAPSFTVTSNPTSATVAAGTTTGNFAVKVTSTNGFNSAVAPVCANLPTGATCTFNPTTVTPPANGSVTTQMTIFVAANVAAATTQVGVSAANATSGATVALTVTPTTESFTVTPNATTGTVTPGAAQPVTLTVTSNSTPNFIMGGNTNLPIQYSCTGLPAASQCNFSPSASTTATSVTLSITTTAPTGKLQFPLSRGSRIFYAMLLPGVFGLVFVGVGRGNRNARTLMMIGFLAVLATSTMWMSACSSNSNKNPGTPAGTYPIVVNATTGGAAPVTTTPFTFSLTVQ